MTATMVDRYPTRRIGEPWRFMDREEPVVYGSPDDGPLISEQLQSFERNGFLKLDGYFEGEALDTLIHEAERMQRETAANDDRSILEPSGRELRSIFEVHRQSELFGRLCSSPKIRDLAAQILKSDVYMHQTRINYKPGFKGKEFYWHSDFETWHSEDGMPNMRAVSCVVNLTENNQFNGPLMIVPGSHKRFVACEGETPEDHYKQSLRKQDYGVPSHEALTALVADGGIAAMEGPPGTVVFFDCNAMHGSSGNITPYPRHNLFMVFNSMKNKLEAPFCGMKPRPEYIASRNFKAV